MGIEIQTSVDKTFKENYINLLNQVKIDLQNWRDLTLSLIGRVNLIKMCILPKFLYLFQCIPFKIPKPFFDDLNKSVRSFLWKGKPPRVKLSTLQAPYSKGGLNLPDFRGYYLAAQFRSIWCWLHGDKCVARWLLIEQHQLKHVPLKSLPFLTSKKTLLNITKNPIILNSFSAWREAHAAIGLNISLFRKAPLCDNPSMSHQITDGIMSDWASKGVKTVEDLYILDTFSNFQQLAEKFQLPKHNLFKYFQIRHWIRNNYSDFPRIPPESPFEKHLMCETLNTSKGFISAIYGILNNNLAIYNKINTKKKWESDINVRYNDDDWSDILEISQSVLISTKHRQIQFNIFNRTYYTPYRLHKMHHNSSRKCQRCRTCEGDLLHMLWKCPILETYWKYIINIASKTTSVKIPSDPRIWILGDIQILDVSFTKKHFILLAGTAGKKCILQNWKAEYPPSQRQWLNELTSYSTPEKIVFSVRRNPEKYEKIWSSFLALLPSLHKFN